MEHVHWSCDQKGYFLDMEDIRNDVLSVYEDKNYFPAFTFH